MKTTAGIDRRLFLKSACVGAATLVSTGARADTAMRLMRPGELRIGTYFVNPPFEFVDKGMRVGFEVDLMKAVAAKLALRPVFVDTRWEVILGEMQDGRYDCIIGGITITADRKRLLNWSMPYMVTTLSLIVDVRRMPGASSIADLKGATVGVQAATTDLDAALALQRAGLIAAVKIYPFARIRDAVSDLEAGRIGAVMKVAPVAAYLVRQRPGLKVIGAVPNDPQPLGIGFDRDNTGLLAAVNGALAKLESDGTYRSLAGKWGLAEFR
jgi:ABC-type amino acid transport substrate-binding protein